MGGVINFITKSAPSNSDLDVNASFKAGSYGYLGSDLNMLGKSNQWNFSLGVKTSKSDGQQFINPNYPEKSSAPQMYNTWFDAETFVGSIGRTLGAHWNVSLRSSYDQRSFGAKKFSDFCN